MGAVDFFEVVDFIDDVVVETGFTEIKLMVAFAHVHLQILVLGLLYLSLTYLAKVGEFDALRQIPEAAADSFPHLRFLSPEVRRGASRLHHLPLQSAFESGRHPKSIAYS